MYNKVRDSPSFTTKDSALLIDITKCKVTEVINVKKEGTKRPHIHWLLKWYKMLTCSLFKNSVSSSDIVLNIRITVNKEFKRIWKEMIVGQFTVYYEMAQTCLLCMCHHIVIELHYSCTCMELLRKTTKTLSQDRWCPS
jgi:hypothetical protein